MAIALDSVDIDYEEDSENVLGSVCTDSQSDLVVNMLADVVLELPVYLRYSAI